MNTKTQIILVAVIALLLGGIGGYFYDKGEGFEGMMGNREENFKAAENKEFTKENDTRAMDNMGGMHDMQGMGSVATERGFIESMIPHHQEAVATAKQVVARGGTTPEIKKLAGEIISAQEKEIADMKTWYKAWYGKDYVDDKSYKPMMRSLTSLSGAELDKAFLEDMIMHHMGALMMAQAVAPYTEHAEVRTLIEGIAETQSSEIITMRIILKQL